MQRKFWKIGLVALGSAVVFSPACASASAPSRYAISLEQVTIAVLLAHPEFAGDAMEIAAPVEARERTPRLSAGLVEHASVSLVVPGSVPAPARLQLHCSSREICLPFYVVVHITGREAVTGAARTTASGSTRSEQAVLTKARQPRGLEAVVNFGARADTDVNEAPLLKSGEAVLLVIDSGRLHLRLPAICLQSGSQGSMIRVRSAVRGLVYKAEVVDQRTVRGSL